MREFARIALKRLALLWIEVSLNCVSLSLSQRALRLCVRIQPLLEQGGPTNRVDPDKKRTSKT